MEAPRHVPRIYFLHTMRIIGGEHKGRKIKQPAFETVRPTKDRIREAVFNIIAAEVPGSSVLDIFAGSGAYGLEALSRGAGKAVFIEKDLRCSKVIMENIDLLGVGDRADIMTEDAFNAMELMGSSGEKFDLVFCDPPYIRGMSKNILIMINHYDIVNHSGFVIIEHHGTEDITGVRGCFTVCKQKTYGDISISVFLKK
ncbi:MAG: 16S rRNA (guanine(966)-N(2))-methyltransferase RsmD [Candidatus Omnitrophota bacterium]|nr:16S rRNA (guanine(966)-N(2))-methyltransferase RsmD [Candidatus Omnitrophota bacterium]